MRDGWWEQSDASVWQEVCAIAKSLRDDQSSRRTRAIAAISTFEGRRLSALSPFAYFKAPAYEDLDWNIPRSLCQTVQAKIAGLQRPKAQFMVTDADWQTKRRAKRLDRFVEGQMFQRQGIYETAWDLGTDVFLDACIQGMGVIKVFADVDANKVQLERVFHWELHTDPQEAENGQPQNLFHTYAYDRRKLLKRFPEKRDAINAARGIEDEREYEMLRDYSTTRRVADMVLVTEAWNLSAGKHAICINGATLAFEDWTRDEFPFVWVRWCKERMGFHATSLIEEVESIAREVNRTIVKMQESERLNTTILDVEDGQYMDEDLESNEAFTIIKRKPGTPPINIHTPNSYGESTLNWLKMNVEQMNALSGVSQMSQRAEKPSGVTAAVALRALADMQSERFSVVTRQYEQIYVSLARHIVACTRELAAENDDFAARWPGQRFVREIKWSDADLDESMYTVRVYAVSGLVNSPTDRYSTAQDLYNGGVIQADTLLRMIDMGDIEREKSRLMAQSEFVEDLIDRYLDAMPDDESFEYESPEPFIIHELAIAQVGQAYLEAKLDRAPEFNLELLRRFITECEMQVQKKTQRMAELQAMAAGAAVQPPTPQVAPTAQPAPMGAAA